MSTVTLWKLCERKLIFGEAMEKEENLLIPGKFVKAATARVGLNVQSERILKGNKSKTGRVLQKIWTCKSHEGAKAKVF